MKNANKTSPNEAEWMKYFPSDDYEVEEAIPPPGAPPHGVWGTERFRGRLTVAATVGGILVAWIPPVGLAMLAFRLDERDAYLTRDGRLFETSGKLIGPVKNRRFIPDRPRPRQGVGQSPPVASGEAKAPTLD